MGLEMPQYRLPSESMTRDTSYVTASVRAMEPTFENERNEEDISYDESISEDALTPEKVKIAKQGKTIEEERKREEEKHSYKKLFHLEITDFFELKYISSSNL